jgi:predicted ATP-grasp superfamily ATP-dependent carboligase
MPAAAIANNRDSAWRKGCPVLVVEAQTLGAIGVIRSLGRAGYPVHACAQQAHAIGLHSNYAHSSIVCPRYEAPDFIGWLREYVCRHEIKVIIPSESMLLAIRPSFEEVARRLPLSERPEVVYTGMSKCDVVEKLLHQGAGNHLPPSFIVESDSRTPSPAALQALGCPLFLKVDACHGRDGRPGKVFKVRSAEAAAELLLELKRQYDKVLIQGHVPGQGVGVFFLRWEGRVLAEFMHRRLHEVPYEGGVSSLRESCFIQAIHDDALAKLEHLDWQGIAMLEYRWDEASGRYHFLELNGRFWGSLHLALFAGVDFPALLVDAFCGHPPSRPPRPALGIRCRHTIPGEVQYVWSMLKAGHLPYRQRGWAALEFLLLSLNPTVYADLLFPGDRQLYWKNMAQYGGEVFRAVGRRLTRRRGNTA